MEDIGDFEKVSELSSALGEDGWLSQAHQGLVAGATRDGGAYGKISIERWYLSPYVEKPFDSKVIKCFVPELRSRKCFSCFGIPMFYVYVCYEHSMYISLICIMATVQNEL